MKFASGASSDEARFNKRRRSGVWGHGAKAQDRSVSDICCAVGLAFNLMWCSLEGHASCFAAAAADIEPLMNPRGFWLLGFCLVALSYLLVPHWLKRWETTLRGIVPLCGTAGTIAFALAPLQQTIPPLALSLAGLGLSGFGYFWFASRCLMLLARARSVVSIGWTIVGAVLLKTFLLPLATDYLDAGAQVAFACAIPVLSTMLLWVAQLSLGVSTVFSLARPLRAERLSPAAQRNFILLLLLSAFLLATVRRLSFWGTWGEASTFSIAPLWGLPELAVMAVCLAAFVWGALARTEKLPVAFRFQPAIVVVVTGLFIAALGQPASNPLVNSAVAVVIHIDEGCAYLLFWAVIALSLDTLDIPPFRVLGTGGIVYAGSSFLWVALGRTSQTWAAPSSPWRPMAASWPLCGTPTARRDCAATRVQGAYLPRLRPEPQSYEPSSRTRAAIASPIPSPSAAISCRPATT